MTQDFKDQSLKNLSPSCSSQYCFILPPYLLKQIAIHGSKEQREAAVRGMSVDATTRASRAMFLAEFGRMKNPILATAPMPKQRTIFNANHQEERSGLVMRIEGQGPVGESSVDEAYDNLGITYDFYKTVFGRSSIDDQGLPLHGIVHYGQHYNNAFWDGQKMVFGDGDGQVFNRFTCAVDIIAHELTHGVVGDEAKLIYLRQPGALNESMADIFGSLVKQYVCKQTVDEADWLIGQGLFLQAPKASLRSLKEPGSAYEITGIGKDPQPAHMEKYVETMEDNGGVHINSGIPNRAFYLLATALGGYAWTKAGKIWYDTLRDPYLKKTTDFATFAARAAVNAGHLFGSHSIERKAVIEAWRQVGVLVEPLL